MKEEMKKILLLIALAVIIILCLPFVKFLLKAIIAVAIAVAAFIIVKQFLDKESK